jgi:lysophospholipase L1-like esterase
VVELMAVGDSLTQGFQSGSIHSTHLSYPALIARALGLDPLAFRVPDFSGAGGLPVNLERLTRRLAQRFGQRVSALEFWPALAVVRGLLDEVEDHWERGPGARPSDSGPLHHNLAVWGFEVGDADSVTEALCRRALPAADDDFIRQVPEMAMYRTARRTLNPGFRRGLQHLSQLDAAAQLAEEAGGIRNLIFWMGANNALGTVTELEIRWSEEADLRRPPHRRNANLWRPEHFERVYRRVADRVDAVGARFVFVGNVPHVTVPPVTRGVSIGAPDRVDGYYQHYTRFWVWDDDFRSDPARYKSLDRDEARRIDDTVDAYNETIAREASQRGWHLVDFCETLDALAFRRRGGDVRGRLPDGLADALEARPALRHHVEGRGDQRRVALDTRFLRLQGSSEERLAAGGLFSLDGVHPTTVGQAVIARQVLETMSGAWQSAGRDAVTPSPAWWTDVLDADTLVSQPPRNLNDLRELLGFLSARGFLRDLVQTLGGRFLR